VGGSTAYPTSNDHKMMAGHTDDPGKWKGAGPTVQQDRQVLEVHKVLESCCLVQHTHCSFSGAGLPIPPAIIAISGGIKPSNSFGAVRSRCLSAAQCQHASLAGYQLHRRGHRFRAHGGILSPDLLIVHYGRWPIRHRLMIERWPGLLDEVPVAPGNHPQPPAVRG
jgi:hypothetical protein